jgi:cyclopropane-fatty-acyl-phospholipid synthase
MNRLLKSFLSRVVARGSLDVVDRDGEILRFGDGTGEPVRVRFADAATERAILIQPALKLGEAFMDGRFVVEKGSIYDFLTLAQNSTATHAGTWWLRMGGRLRRATRRLRQMNHTRAARRNVAHHYDLGDELYKLFLDEDWQYSCAYFPEGVTDLDEAQLAKKRHIAAKLALRPGDRVLDIGSGWGGLGLYLAPIGEAEVTGVTLSDRQHARSNRRAAEAGLADRARFILRDYRHIEDRFDRIVSVGMFEHVGVNHYDAFFRHAAGILADDGVMLLHSIGRFDEPGDTNPWIHKYIFPGGYIPALSEVLPAVEASRLLVRDTEILSLHYAETTRAWRERFLANRERVLELYDERFIRMWEFYLAGSEASFRFEQLHVFHLQLAHDQARVPLTRDYIPAELARLTEAECAVPDYARLHATPPEREPARLSGIS